MKFFRDFGYKMKYNSHIALTMVLNKGSYCAIITTYNSVQERIIFAKFLIGINIYKMVLYQK